MHRPEALEDRIVAVDVIPAGVDDASVVQHAGVPLVGLVERELADVRPVGVGPVEHVGRHVAAAVAAAVLLAAGRDERESSVGQVARIVVLDHHGLPADGADHRVGGRPGQLPKLAAVDRRLVDEKRLEIAGAAVAAEGEQHPAAVEGKVRMIRHSRRQLVLQQEPHPRIVLPRLQHRQARSGSAVSAEVLVAHVPGHVGDALVQQDLVEVQQRMGKDDLPPQFLHFAAQRRTIERTAVLLRLLHLSLDGGQPRRHLGLRSTLLDERQGFAGQFQRVVEFVGPDNAGQQAPDRTDCHDRAITHLASP